MASIVPSLYQSVIDDVINSVRDVFLDDGLDEQVLAELKQTWERKLFESKSMDHSVSLRSFCTEISFHRPETLERSKFAN